MSDYRKYWGIDPQITYLNHGSLGNCPLAVLEKQTELRRRMEAELITFVDRDLEGLLFDALRALADFVGAQAEDVVFVENATTGVNAVLRSLTFAEGDELLTTNHEYNACKNALHFVADRFGATVEVADIPFPIQSSDQVYNALMAKVTNRTRLLMISHLTSPTALLFPVERIVDELNQRGIDTLIDGAHVPGMLPLNLDELGAAYYTGNCHKWMCTPKGSGFLHVRRDKQAQIRPLTISHGANSRRTDLSRFQLEFGWTGTKDYTPWLCVPIAIKHINEIFPGGWSALMERNRNLTLEMRGEVCNALGVEPPCPDDMLGAMAALPLPDGDSAPPPMEFDPLQNKLFHQFHLEIPVISWPVPPKRLLRYSVQIYNSREDLLRLTSVLYEVL